MRLDSRAACILSGRLFIIVFLFLAPADPLRGQGRWDNRTNDAGAQGGASSATRNGSGVGALTQDRQPSGANSARENSSKSNPPQPALAETAEAPPSEPGKTGGALSGIASGGIVSMIRRAGLMAIPILACSFLLVTFVFERAIMLRRRRVVPKHFVKRFLEELDEGELKADEALELCEQNRSPVAAVFAAGIKRWGRPCVEVEQAVLDAGEREANNLRRHLRLFNGISTICPLFGLLGTVLGMIESFNTIASSDAMGRPEMLASGIGQAMLTTAGGLSVAIPAFIAYIYFTGRVDRLVHRN